MRVLVTWSDRSQAVRARRVGDVGPVMRFLSQEENSWAYQRALVLTGVSNAPASEELVAEMSAYIPAVELRAVPLEDPSDYGALFRLLSPIIEELGRHCRQDGWQIDLLLSAGTPQAAARSHP